MVIMEAVGLSECLGNRASLFSRSYNRRGCELRGREPVWRVGSTSWGYSFVQGGRVRIGRAACKHEESKRNTLAKPGVGRQKKSVSKKEPDTRMKRLENVIEEIDKLGPSGSKQSALKSKSDAKPSAQQLKYEEENARQNESDSWGDSQAEKGERRSRSAASLGRPSERRDTSEREYHDRFAFSDNGRAPDMQDERMDDMDPDGDMGRGAQFLRKALKPSASFTEEVGVAETLLKAAAAPRVPPRNQRAGGRLVRESDKLAIAAPWKPACYGCGVVLQTTLERAPGFVEPERFELKRKHHQLRSLLCGRCVELSQGRMVAAVGGHGGYGDGPGFLLASELRSQLVHLKSQKALIVKLVDIIDFNGSFLSKVRDLVGPNPIILVVTKVDLLPKGTDMEAVGDWVLSAVTRKKLNVVSIHLTSAKAELGISSVAAKLRERQGRDVYVVGAANVGKSAFISALLEEMAERDPAAAAARRRKPMQSAMPGTTLGHISIKAFSGGGELFDTPGVHLHHRIAAVVSPVDLPTLAPRRRLKGFTPLPPGSTPDEEDDDWEEVIDPDATSASEDPEPVPRGEAGVLEASEEIVGEQPRGGLAGCSLFWGGLARIDVLVAPTSARFTFMGPGQIRVRCVPTAEADQFYRENVGSLLVPPTKSSDDEAPSWEDLPARHSFVIPARQVAGPSADIALSGLGWVTVMHDEALHDEQPRDGVMGVIRLEVRTPRGVEVYMRPPIPVGPRAKTWYKWREFPDEDVVEPGIFFEKEKASQEGVLQR